jgi:hypothetical protein
MNGDHVMEELIARISQTVGIDPELAQKAIGMILGFLQKEAPAEQVDALLQAIPGADGAIAAAQEAGSGGGLMGMVGGLMGGMGGGGIMALGTQLMGQGLSMGQIEQLGKEVFSYAKQHAGEDVMGTIVSSVPGLSRFV